MSNSSNSDRLDFIRLARTDGIGAVTFRKLIARFGTPTAALEFLEKERKQPAFPVAKAEKELEKAAKIGATAIFAGTPEYPDMLAQIPDRPPVIYILGDPETLHVKTVALVGSRNASINARNFAHSLARGLVDRGYVVASGMAIGIDAAAHEGALVSIRQGQKTVAVLAGGVDVIYPPSNRTIYEKIIEKGSIVSEMPPGTEPQAAFFPRRNRIVSGLSLGVVVVEAGIRSGSLITAKFAAAQGREVFAVPNFPLDPRSLGANSLIKEGATLTDSVDDITDVLDGLRHDFSPREPTMEFKVCEDSPNSFGDVPAPDTRAALLSLLGANPTSLNEIIRALPDVPRQSINTTLLELELDDKIDYTAGGVVAKL
ncbi:MAG: DNA-processing protein DprA [Rickettsiales bacterium]|jgi:DNA processing protein|nr:DNA-processing protein DprA [Rickettsiales bacterium]